MTWAGFIIIAASLLALALGGYAGIRRAALVKLFFAAFILCALTFCISTLRAGDNAILALAGSLWMYAAFAFVLLHACGRLGPAKASIFFAISLLSGFISEYLGTAYGWVYGSYYYHSLPPFFFGLVPLTTPLSWAIIIYMCWTLTDMFYRGLGGKDTARSIISAGALLLLLSAVDGLIAVGLDMILDPVAVSPQVAGWVWVGGGEYFGVPLSNFIGWFLVTFISTLLFRVYLYSSGTGLPKGPYSSYAPIVALYFAYYVLNAAQAIAIGHVEYALIGAATMLPFCLLALLLLYIRRADTVEKEPV